MAGGEQRLVRAMVASDAERVAELCGQLGYPSSAVEVRARFDVLCGRPDEGMFVAADGAAGIDAVIGWVHVRPSLTLESDPCAEIAGLVVDAAARSAGVGQALVAAAERWAVEHGYGEIRVRSNVVRERAHAFYRRLGYEVVKAQVNFRKTLDQREVDSRQ